MIVLSERHEDLRSVKVIQRKSDGSRLYIENGAVYTQVDADCRNQLAYVTAMVAHMGDAQEVLVLGTAGGALATALHRLGVRVTAVDIWAPAFDLARAWFGLPSDVDCVAADAVAFLQKSTRPWQAIAVDVYTGVEIPPSMITPSALKLVRNALAPGGRLVWNVADAATSFTTRDLVRKLQAQGLDPKCHPVWDDDVGNTIVVCRLESSSTSPAPEASIIIGRRPIVD